MRLAGVQANVKDYDGAIGSLHKAIALQPDLASAWLALANVYAIAGRNSDGIADARKLQKEYPKRALGYVIEGQILVGQKKPSESAVAFREGLAREPIPLLIVLSYQALQSAGKPDQAAALAQRWQKDHPKDVQLRSFLAQQAVVAKDYAVAVQQYKAVLEAEPDNVTALNNLAWSLNELGDPKALEYGERASLIAPNVPSVADTYGWILVQRGDAKRGLELLREASRLAPQDTEIRLHLAKALLKTGDKAAAKSELEALVVQGDATRARTEAQQMLNAL
jgi:putative PEP-CTERM system TPR-repeat lipoprotein